MYRIGVDTGGTNTDIVLSNINTGKVFSAKTATSENLIDGIFKGIDRISEQSDVDKKDIEELVYGTTIVVNMIAQRESESVALITTKGYRDALEIGRAWRDEQIYNNFLDKPEPLVKRNLRFEVAERINFQGDTIEDLNEQEVSEVIKELKERKIRSVAISLLHAYRNPKHERRIKEMIKQEYPEIYVSLSSEVNPEFREYERTSTTVINAYMMPNMVSHLSEFKEELNKKDMQSTSYMMNANAGIMGFNSAIEKPVSVSNSGPIGGIIAANHLGNLIGEENIITFDMGGTSCDVSLIQKNIIPFRSDSEIAGYPISIPTVDLDFIGAGGGSIAWCDKGGALKVGPKSAGSLPGPVCYQRGGTEPTVTDANVLLGRIRPEIFLEDLGDVLDKTSKIMDKKIAKPLDLDLMHAAEGIIQVVNANMARAIKLVSVQRGYDPSEFTLVSFGGAGGLHAGKLAEELEMPKVIVPYSAGTFAALGQVLADIKHDFVYTDLKYLDDLSIEEINTHFKKLIEDGISQLQEEDVNMSNQVLIKSIDLRYFGQAYELNIPLPDKLLTEEDIDNAKNEFHQLHEDTYGHALREDKIEVVKYRVSSIGLMDKTSFSQESHVKVEETKEKNVTRGTVIFDGKSYDVPVYDRSTLEVGFEINEPAIIGEMGATTVIYPGHSAIIDEYLSIIISTNIQKNKKSE